MYAIILHMLLNQCQYVIIESMNKKDYHTISASNDKHVKLMREKGKPQNEPVKQDTPFTESMKFLIIIFSIMMGMGAFNAVMICHIIIH